MEDHHPNTDVIVANCLNCKGLVRVPIDAPSSSQVKCPRCSITYTLAQIINESIPQLEILPPEPAPEIIPRVDQILEKKTKTGDEAKEEGKKFVVPVQLAKGARKSRRRRRSSESNGSSSSGRRRSSSSSSRSSSSSEIISERSESTSRPERAERSRTRPKKKQAGGIGEVVKIVVGGALALPIAYFIIMWVFNKDPLGMAPSLSNTVPFVVPKSLRESDVPSDENSEATNGESEKVAAENNRDSDSNAIAGGADDEVKSRGGVSVDALLQDAANNDLAFPNVDPDSLNKK